MFLINYFRLGRETLFLAVSWPPDRKVDIKDNQLSIKLIPMISTWDQVDPIFPVRPTRVIYRSNINNKYVETKI
jgi:hypothetical protein